MNSLADLSFRLARKGLHREARQLRVIICREELYKGDEDTRTVRHTNPRDRSAPLHSTRVDHHANLRSMAEQFRGELAAATKGLQTTLDRYVDEIAPPMLDPDDFPGGVSKDKLNPGPTNSDYYRAVKGWNKIFEAADQILEYAQKVHALKEKYHKLVKVQRVPSVNLNEHHQTPNDGTRD